MAYLENYYNYVLDYIDKKRALSLDIWTIPTKGSVIE